MVCGILDGSEEPEQLEGAYDLEPSFAEVGAVIGGMGGFVQVDFHHPECPNDSWRRLLEIPPNGPAVESIGRGLVGDQEVSFPDL